ncbi:MAG: flagellar protein FlaG [Pseudomonadota bacterium]
MAIEQTLPSAAVLGHGRVTTPFPRESGNASGSGSATASDAAGVPGSPAANATPPVEAVDEAQLEESAAQLQDLAKLAGRQINFEVDEELGQTLVKVVDPQTGDVIRQLPPEFVVATAAALAEMAESGRDDPPPGLLIEDAV